MSSLPNPPERPAPPAGETDPAPVLDPDPDTSDPAPVEAPRLPPAPDPLWPLRARRPEGVARLGAVIGLFLLVVSLPLWVGGSGAGFLVDLAVLVALAQWWGLLAGFSDTPCLAGGFYAGTGTYLWAALVEWGGLNPVLAVAVAALGVAVVAMPTGWLLLRLAPAWGGLTGLVLAAAGAQLVAVLDRSAVAGRDLAVVGELGVTLRRGLTTWLAVVIGVGSVAAVVALRRSRLGLAVIAHRDDPEAAATLGVRDAGARLIIWVLAAVAAGACGAVVHFRSGTVSVGEAFDPLIWVLPAVVAAALGGMRTLSGPVLGALSYVVMERIFGVPAALAVCAGAAAVLLVLVPRGLADHLVPALRERAGSWWVRYRPPPGERVMATDALTAPSESNTTTAAPR